MHVNKFTAAIYEAYQGKPRHLSCVIICDARTKYNCLGVDGFTMRHAKGLILLKDMHGEVHTVLDVDKVQAIEGPRI